MQHVTSSPDSPSCRTTDAQCVHMVLSDDFPMYMLETAFQLGVCQTSGVLHEGPSDSPASSSVKASGHALLLVMLD